VLSSKHSSQGDHGVNGQLAHNNIKKQNKNKKHRMPGGSQHADAWRYSTQ
jgi:hypothetical protein